MKRFTATEKWDDPWFLDLTPEAKLMWLYLCDKCDNAGVIDLHPRKARFELGIDGSVEQLIGELGDKIRKLDNGKYHVPAFVPFQYGDLNSNSNIHKSVRNLLESHGMAIPSSSHHHPIMMGPGKGKGKGKGKDIEGECREGDKNGQAIINSIREIINRSTGGQILPQKLKVEYEVFMSWAKGQGIPNADVAATLAHAAKRYQGKAITSGKQLTFIYGDLRKSRGTVRVAKTDEELRERYGLE